MTEKSERLQKRDPIVYLSITERRKAFARSRMRGDDHPHVKMHCQALQAGEQALKLLSFAGSSTFSSLCKLTTMYDFGVDPSLPRISDLSISGR